MKEEEALPPIGEVQSAYQSRRTVELRLARRRVIQNLKDRAHIDRNDAFRVPYYEQYELNGTHRRWKTLCPEDLCTLMRELVDHYGCKWYRLRTTRPILCCWKPEMFIRCDGTDECLRDSDHWMWDFNPDMEFTTYDFYLEIVGPGSGSPSAPPTPVTMDATPDPKAVITSVYGGTEDTSGSGDDETTNLLVNSGPV